MGGLAEILAGLGALLPAFQKNSARSEAHADAALSAVVEALTETQVYLNTYQRTGRRNLKTEGRLVKLWRGAAVPLRHVDRGLADRCMHKGEYWLNPESYTTNDIKRLGIGIQKVQEDAERLLADN